MGRIDGIVASATRGIGASVRADAAPAVRSAAELIAAGTLPRARPAAVADDLERVLRDGLDDVASRRPVGEGMNGMLTRIDIHDPADPARILTAVEKPAGAQAAQEELGWRLGRALGIDHLLPAVARRADGTARIELRPGVGLSQAGVTDVERLEAALAASHSPLGLSPADTALSARTERQLLQVFDYLLANNDRRPSNGLVDAAAGVSFIDAGHAGRGTLPQNGGTVLEPALMLFQAGKDGGRVTLDAGTVDYLRARLTPSVLRNLHTAVFDAPGIAGPPSRTFGERFIGHVRSDGYRDGMVARLEHVLDTGGYSHAGWKPDNAGEMPPLVDDRVQRQVRGFNNVRAAMHGGGMF